MTQIDWKKRLEEADKIRLIVTGQNRHFKTWCREHLRIPGGDAIFIDHSDKLRGLDPKKYDVVLLHDAYQMQNFHEIETILESRGFTYRNDRDGRIKFKQ